MFYNRIASLFNYGPNMKGVGTKLCVLSCLAVTVLLSSSVGGMGVPGVAQPQNNVASLIPAELPQAKGHQDGERRNKTHNDLVVNNKGKYYNGGGGGGFGWGWGWGGGGRGGGSWGWGCRKQARHRNGGGRGMNRNHHDHVHKKRVGGNHGGAAAGGDEYKVGEFAQCVVEGRCRGRRLDCPLHCGGPCFCDCIHMCKAHCRRPL